MKRQPCGCSCVFGDETARGVQRSVSRAMRVAPAGTRGRLKVRRRGRALLAYQCMGMVPHALLWPWKMLKRTASHSGKKRLSGSVGSCRPAQAGRSHSVPYASATSEASTPVHSAHLTLMRCTISAHAVAGASRPTSSDRSSAAQNVSSAIPAAVRERVRVRERAASAPRRSRSAKMSRRDTSTGASTTELCVVRPAQNRKWNCAAVSSAAQEPQVRAPTPSSRYSRAPALSEARVSRTASSTCALEGARSAAGSPAAANARTPANECGTGSGNWR